MKLPAMLVADLHLTSNVRDEYRWGLWPWLRNTAVDERVKTINVLGDLSDSKDFHPSSLVNRIASEIRQTAEVACVERVNMIPGNHEWLKEGEEFWRFLNYVHAKVRYMVRPTEDDVVAGASAYFLPFTKTPKKDWQGMNFEDVSYVFMHQTLKGSVSSNGQEMEGEDLPSDVLATARKVYSGDIHVPQKLGVVEYVGSPYHVHFGDSFRPRVVLLEENGNAVDLRFNTLSRVTLDVLSLRDLDKKLDLLTSGDQVKVRMHLPESEKHEWKAMRRRALAMLADVSVEVHGMELLVEKSQQRLAASADREVHARLSPEDQVLRFVTTEELGPDALDTALEVIES